MATQPTIKATELIPSIIKGKGMRLEFIKGDGDRRLVSITEGSDVKYPINGVNYNGNLKYTKGDPLISDIDGGSCSSIYPIKPDRSVETKTYVVYDGDDGNSIDIIELKPKTSYSIVVYEYNDYCYLRSDILKVHTGFEVNNERFEIYVYDSRTRLPIKNSTITFYDRSKFVSDFGETDEQGKYQSINVEEGRYELHVNAMGYEHKILTGLFIQRVEPRRDNYYRIFTSAGNTEMGSSVERDYYQNKNTHKIYLDPSNKTINSFNRYDASPNPSYITKL